MHSIIQGKYIYNLHGFDCVNEAIIHTENENHSILEAYLADSVLKQAIRPVIQSIRGESRPAHSCSAGQMERNWPGLSAYIPPWTRTRCWAVG